MPQFNHFETKSGQRIDPTFGLNALSEESERKTKAREQMNTAAMVLRQSLGQRGKGLSTGTTATVSEGGGIEFTGTDAAKDESRLYNTGTANYGKTGKGINTREVVSRDGLNALKAQFGARNAQAAQSQAGMQAAGNNAIGAYNATTLNTTLPTQTGATGTTTQSNNTPTPISQTTSTILGGVLPASLIAPIYHKGVSLPLSNTQPAAAPVQQSGGQQPGQQQSSSMQAGTSVSYATGGGSNSYQGTPQVDSTTESDIEVRDQQNMNQSDLMVNDAMQALAFHLSGGQSPGTFKNAIDQNNKTMNATNKALAKQGTSQTVKVGAEGETSSAPTTSLTMSKDQKVANASGTPRQAPNMKKFFNPSGQDIDVESKAGMLQFNGKVNGVSLVLEPNVINHSSTQSEFVNSFNNHYNGVSTPYGKDKYQIKHNPKTGKDEIFVDGDSVGYVTPAKSTGQFDKTGTWTYGGVPAKQTYGLIFTKPVSETDFNQITVQGAR